MGEWVDFEEKEYETLMNASFVLDAGTPSAVRIYSPGQFLENTLGIDFATRVPAHSRLRAHLFGARTARGVTAHQAQINGLPVTAKFVNFFTQYKRPTRFHAGHRSPLWERDQDFLRFTVTHQKPHTAHDFTQIEAMDQLQTTFGANASVRYLCPAVSTSAALYASFAAGRLPLESVVVSVDAMRLGTGFHRHWTFRSDDLGFGIPNPGGPAAKSTSYFEYVQDLVDVDVQRMPSKEQVERTGELVREFTEDSPSYHKLVERKTKDTVRREESERTEILHELEPMESAHREAVLTYTRVAAMANDLGLDWSIAVID